MSILFWLSLHLNVSVFKKRFVTSIYGPVCLLFQVPHIVFSRKPHCEVILQHTQWLFYMTLVEKGYKIIPALSTGNMNYSLSMVTQSHSYVQPLCMLKYSIPLRSPAELQPSNKSLSHNTKHLMNHSPH